MRDDTNEIGKNYEELFFLTFPPPLYHISQLLLNIHVHSIQSILIILQLFCMNRNKKPARSPIKRRLNSMLRNLKVIYDLNYQRYKGLWIISYPCRKQLIEMVYKM